MNPRLVILREFEAQAAEPFAWGMADCLTWCAGCAKAITGRDPRKGKGLLRYRSALGAARIVKAHGGSTRGLAAAMYPEIPVAQARSGDWAWIEEGDTLGVVHGAMIAARTEARGLGQIPLMRAAAAFRVE